MGELSKLPNIGKTVEEQLLQVGITTAVELKSAGAKAAWLKIQEIDETACIHRLLALEGAIRGVKKSLLPEEIKADLREFYREHKK
ncbi:MAG: TfoX/Sxy family protein [Ruminiclostridium sp.]